MKKYIKPYIREAIAAQTTWSFSRDREIHIPDWLVRIKFDLKDYLRERSKT